MSKSATTKRFLERKVKVDQEIVLECYERYMCGLQSMTTIAADTGLAISTVRRFIKHATELMSTIIEEDIAIARQRAIARTKLRVRELEEMIENYQDGTIVTLGKDRAIEEYASEKCMNVSQLILAVHDRIIKYENLLMQLEGTKKLKEEQADNTIIDITPEDALRELE